MAEATRARAGERRMWQPPGRYPQGAVSFLKAVTSASGTERQTLSEALRAGSAAGWLKWLGEHGLAPYAYHRLKQTGALAELEPELQTGLRQAYYAAVGDAELHREELAGVLGALREAGVSAVLFKGAVLAYTAYPDPACRPMGDLDLWAPEESMARAQAALEAAGYRQHHKGERPAALQAQYGGEVQLGGGAAGQGLVELHYSTFAGEWVRQTTAIEGDCVACRTTPVMAAGCEAWALGAEDAVLQLAVHLAVNHQMSYPGVRGLLDVVLQTRAQPPDWNVVGERARAWRVGAATWLVLATADELFGLPGAGQAIRRLKPGRVRHRLLRRFARAETVLMGRDLTRGPVRFLYQLLLVDRARDAGRLLWRTAWPEDGWLRLRYGKSGVAVRLRHLGGVLRGRP